MSKYDVETQISYETTQPLLSNGKNVNDINNKVMINKYYIHTNTKTN